MEEATSVPRCRQCDREIEYSGPEHDDPMRYALPCPCQEARTHVKNALRRLEAINWHPSHSEDKAIGPSSCVGTAMGLLDRALLAMEFPARTGGGA